MCRAQLLCGAILLELVLCDKKVPTGEVSKSGVTVAHRGAAVSPIGSGSDSTSGLGAAAWEHDVEYMAGNIKSGLPGLEKEVHDTVFNLEHLNSKTGSSLFRGFVWVALIYLGVGSAIRHQKEGARGIDMIPHFPFWCASARLMFDVTTHAKNIILDALTRGSRGATRASQGSAPQAASHHFGTFELSRVQEPYDELL
jgi:hypothetical protein